MVAEIYGGIAAFKAMFDLAKGIKDISDAALRNSAVIELQEKILAAQSAQSNLIERIRELETQMAEMEQWKGEKQRYQPEERPPGVHIFTLKKECANPGEPIHSLCPACYTNNKKSILQKGETTNGQYKL